MGPSVTLQGTTNTKNGILVSENGHGNTDRLFSIEKILCTYRDDKVIITDVNMSNYELTGSKIFFDGKAGNDTLDLSNANGNVLIAAENAPLASSASITFDSFEIIKGAKNYENTIDARNSTVDEGITITGGDRNDIVYGSIQSDTIDGGDGDDELYGEDGDDILTGGGGKDELHGGIGVDTYYAGMGDTIYDASSNGGDAKGNVYFDNQHVTNLYKITAVSTIPPEITALAGTTQIYTYNGIAAWKKDGGVYLYKYGTAPTQDSLIFVSGWANNKDVNISLLERPGSDPGGNTPIPWGYASPLVFDLDGDGIELTWLYESSAYFDIDNDGLKENTAWVSADDGFLVLDRNGNGIIDDASELFGYQQTIAISWYDTDDQHAKAGYNVDGESGFGILSVFDENQDGVIDAFDAIYNELRIWRDLNQNGYSDEGEMFSLTELGIVSINLDAEKVNKTNNGNIITDSGSFTWADGSQGIVEDVWFQMNQGSTQYEHPELDESFDGLPNLASAGRAKDLLSTAYEDAELKAMIEELADLSPAEMFKAASIIEDLVYRWHAFNAREKGYGPYTNPNHQIVYESLLDIALGQDLARYDENDKKYLTPQEYADKYAYLYGPADTLVEKIYQIYIEQVTARLVLQTEWGQALFPEISLESGEFFSLDENADLATMLVRLEANAPDVLVDKLSYWNTVLKVLKPVHSDFFNDDGSSFKNLVNAFLKTQNIDLSYDQLLSAILAGEEGDPIYTTYTNDVVESVLNLNETSLIRDTHLRDHDIIWGTKGDDEIRVNGTSEHDIFYFGKGSGHDIIVADIADTLGHGHNIEIRIPEYSRDDIEITRLVKEGIIVFTIKETGETLTIRSDHVIHLGQLSVTFSDGQKTALVDFVSLGDGDDHVTGTEYVDIFYGGKGNDYLNGRHGNDIYHFNRGDGQDIIEDDASTSNYGPNYLSTADVLQFGEGIDPSDIIVTQADKGNLVLSIRGTTDSVTLKYQITQSRIEIIRFADGTEWNPQELLDLSLTFTDGNDYLIGDGRDNIISGGAGDDRIFGLNGNDIIDGGSGNDMLYGGAGDDILTGGDGNDILYGDAGDDILTGGKGDDVLYGGNGNNTYIYALGDGNDRIDNQGSTESRLKFTDLNSEDLVFSSVSENNLLITVIQTQETITIQNIFSSYGPTSWSQFIEFADGTIWDADAIYKAVLRATNGDDIIQGTAKNDVIYGGTGNDILHGGTGNDSLYGEDGNDILYGGEGDDILHGGKGNDYLYGGHGNDTYIFNLGDGQDTISDYPYYGVSIGLDGSTHDVLQFGEGINPEDIIISLSNYGRDLVLSIRGTDDSVTLVEQGLQEHINFVRFADGTEWSAETLKEVLGNTFYGTDGNDTIYSTNDDDMIYGGAGNDTLYGLKGNDTLHGGDGDDRLYGSDGNDILIGGRGNDIMDGGSEDDIYVYSKGDGYDTIIDHALSTDTLRFTDLNSSDIILTRHNNDHLYITIIETGEQITITQQFSYAHCGIQQIEFADGTTWNNDQINAAVVPHRIMGSSQKETLYGTQENNEIWSGAGNDTVYGQAGSDTYHWGRGDGDDTFHDNSELSEDHDVLKLDGLNASDVHIYRNGLNLNVKIKDTGEILTVKYQFKSSGYAGMESIVFADGTVWNWEKIKEAAETPPEYDSIITGTHEDERLTGTAGDDLFIGGKGNDLFNPDDEGTFSKGSDTYIYAKGDGNDIIKEYDTSTESVDTLRFTDINVSDVILGQDGDTLHILIKQTGEYITIDKQFGEGGSGLEQIIFADWTIWDKAQMAFSATRASNAIYGTDDSETLYGTVVNDIFYSGKGDDWLNWGDGGKGSDTYIYSKGDGNDIIDDYDASTISIDTLEFLDINASDVILTRDNEHLYIIIKETGERITVNKQFWDGGYGLEQIWFEDWTVWNVEDIEAAVIPGIVYGSSNSEWLFGTGEDNEIWTGAGNDIVRGYDGSDIYHWGRGDGNDHFHDYNERSEDHDVLKLDGLNADDVEFWREGKDLYVRIKNTHETLRVEDQFLASGFGGVESVEFADGTSWNWDQIKEKAEQYKNVVTGVDGQHWVDGTSASDIIRSGSDDNFMRGFTGSDIYLWGRGDGNDKLEDWGNWEDHDVIRLTNLNASDVDIVRNGEHLTIRVKDTGETLEVLGHFLEDRPWSIEEIEFADGTSWNKDEIADNLSTHFVIDERHGHHSGDYLWIDGTNANDIISSGAGNAFMKGYAGDDIYIWGRGDGDDRLEEWGTADDHDILRLRDLNVSDVDIIRSDESLLIRIRDTGEYLTIVRQYTEGWFWDIEEIQFSDGTSWNKDEIADNLSTHFVIDERHGYHSGDYLWIDGTNTNDIISSGAGNAFMKGYAGDDIYIWGRGDGNDRLEEWGTADDHDILRLRDLNVSDIEVFHSDESLLIRIKDTGEYLTIVRQYAEGWFWDIEEIEFADGTIWNQSDIQTNLSSHFPVNGVDGQYWVDGTNGSDIIRSGSDDNFMRGFAGSDIYLWGRGDGNDKMEDWGNWEDHDVIRLTNLNASDIDLTRHENDLVIRIKDNGETLKVLGHFMEDRAWDIEAIEFADGTSWDSAQIRNVAETGISAANAVAGSSYALSADSDDTFLFNNELYHVSEDEIVNAGLPQENIRASDYNQILESAPPAENYSVLPELPFAFSLHEDDFSFAA